jgi:hypothetical protein
MHALVISHPHVHRIQVRVLVAVLRAALPAINEAVYWDDTAAPGPEWAEQMRRSIDEAPKLFVLWCRHAAGSIHMRAEFEYARARGKTVVAVLLDDTPLFPILAASQRIDLRDVMRHDDSWVGDEAVEDAEEQRGIGEVRPVEEVDAEIGGLLAAIVDRFEPHLAEPT